MVYSNIHETFGDLCGEESTASSNQDDDTGTASGNEELAEREVRKTVQVGWSVKTIDDILRRYPTCPPDAFFHLKEFYTNKKIYHYLEDSKHVKVSLRNWCAELNDWTISDYVQFYNRSDCHPYFNGYGRNGVSVYFSPD